MLRKVNEILGDHNVDKQISDSKGDIAYLMADVSNVKFGEIKDLWERLELLSCESPPLPLHFLLSMALLTVVHAARVLTRVLY